MRTTLLTHAIVVGAIGCASCATNDVDREHDQTGEGGGKADGVGPGSGTDITFVSTSQKGGLWELGGGDIYTAFQTGSEFLPYARTRYTFQFGIVEPGDSEQRDASLLGAAGSCVQDSDSNYGCAGGLLTPSSQKHLSIVSHDDRILLASTYQVGRDYRPRLTLIDPAGGMPTEVFADFTTMTASYQPGETSASRTIEYRLQRLPSGDILFSAAVDGGVVDRSFVLDDSGAVLGEVDGFAMGYRSGPLEILVLRKPATNAREYVWWNRGTAQTSPAAIVPAATGQARPLIHRPVVTQDGGLMLWPVAEDRVIHFSAAGALERDDTLASGSKLKGVLPSGAALVQRYVTIAGGWDWSLVLVNGDGTEQTVYSKATLRTDSGWNLSDSSFSYPHLDGIYEPVIDDAGNSYIPFVQATGGDTRTQTYVVGFSSAGERLFGVELEAVSGGRCLPHSVLPSSRLAVVCERRVTNDFYLLGE